MKYPMLERVLAGEGADQFAKQLYANKGAPEEEVKKAAQVAHQGGWLERLIGIAEAIGSKWAPHLKNLEAIQTEAGHKPNGLQELGDEIGGKLLFDMVMHRQWTRDQLQYVAWGLPLDDLQMWGLDDLRSKNKDTVYHSFKR
jgi:hypothetical protein